MISSSQMHILHKRCVVLVTRYYVCCPSVRLSVCICSETAEWIWLKSHAVTEVSHEHCIWHFRDDRPKDPVRAAEMYREIVSVLEITEHEFTHLALSSVLFCEKVNKVR